MRVKVCRATAASFYLLNVIAWMPIQGLDAAAGSPLCNVGIAVVADGEDLCLCLSNQLIHIVGRVAVQGVWICGVRCGALYWTGKDDSSEVR